MTFTSFVELWFLFLNFHNWKSLSSESGLLQPGNHLIIYFRSKTYCLFFYRLVLQKKLISCRKAIQLKSTVCLTTKKKKDGILETLKQPKSVCIIKARYSTQFSKKICFLVLFVLMNFPTRNYHI